MKGNAHIFLGYFSSSGITYAITQTYTVFAHSLVMLSYYLPEKKNPYSILYFKNEVLFVFVRKTTNSLLPIMEVVNPLRCRTAL